MNVKETVRAKVQAIFSEAMYGKPKLDPDAVDAVITEMYPDEVPELDMCLCCGVRLHSADNGAVCLKCEAEEEHDWDMDPDAEFDRYGRLIDD